MSEIYEDILRRLKRNALKLEVCKVVFGMCLLVGWVMWSDTRSKEMQMREGLGVVWLLIGAALALSGFFGLRASEERKRLRAEKAAYEKNSFIVAQRARHLTRRQSEVLQQKVTDISGIAEAKIVYDRETAAKDAPYVFHSVPAACGAAFAICAVATLLVLVLLYAALTYKSFVPSEGMKQSAAIAALGAVAAMCLRWYRLRKRGRIPRELQRVSGWYRHAEAIAVLFGVACLTYFIVAYGFGQLMQDFLG